MNWMTYLQQFNLVIMYKKGAQNKLADMLSRPPVTSICLSIVMEVQPSMHDDYKQLYAEDSDFSEVVKIVKVEKPSDFTFRGELLYKGSQLCVPKDANRLRWLREAHTSKVAGHFRVNKTI
jgi:hypothetical protein